MGDAERARLFAGGIVGRLSGGAQSDDRWRSAARLGGGVRGRQRRHRGRAKDGCEPLSLRRAHLASDVEMRAMAAVIVSGVSGVVVVGRSRAVVGGIARLVIARVRSVLVIGVGAIVVTVSDVDGATSGDSGDCLTGDQEKHDGCST